MVESGYNGDSSSRSPMTESPSPIHQHRLSQEPAYGHQATRLLYSRSPDTILQQQQQQHFQRQAHQGRTSSGAGGVTTTAASLFTIDSILAPRPMGNVPAAAAAAAAASLAAMQQQQQQGSDGSNAAGVASARNAAAAAAAAAVHPLQQQLHHLAFTSADFLGECRVMVVVDSVILNICSLEMNMGKVVHWYRLVKQLTNGLVNIYSLITQ